MSLETEVQELTKASNEQTAASQGLSQEVAGKMAAIDQKVDDAVARLENGEVDSLKIGWIKFAFHTISGDAVNQFVHMKTNIKRYESRMIGLNFSGYQYGLGVIDTDVSFYVYQQPGYADQGILHSWVVRHKGASKNLEDVAIIDVTYYFSPDDYLVLVISGINNYARVNLNQINTGIHQTITMLETKQTSTIDPAFT